MENSNLKSETFIYEENTPWEPCGEDVKRQIMGYGPDLMLVKACFGKGAVGAIHSHPHVQSSYVAAGVFEVTVGEETRTLRKGDGFYVESGLPHGVRCLEKGTLIETFTPCRQDFL